MQSKAGEVNPVPLPDARTAYHVRRVKDKVVGTATSWDAIQPEYWPVIELMEGLEKAQDRNATFTLWLLKLVADPKVRNEVHRRVDLAFEDPDRPLKKGEFGKLEYFEEMEVISSSIVWAKDVQEKEIEWLWPGRIPRGKQTTLAGPGGVGKSFLLCDITARVSIGGEWPFSGGECAPVGNVLYISGEDDPDDTLVPRLRLQGADLARVAFLSPQELIGFNVSGPKFREVIDRASEEMGGVSLIVLDPPSSFLAGIDENSNAEVRGFLTPMKEWAKEHNCSIIFNTHVNKAKGKKMDAAERVISSVAMVNGPRAAHMVFESEDQPDLKLFVPLKINIWQKMPALSFRIVPDLHEVDHAKLEWVGEVDIDACTAVNGRDEDDNKRSSILEAENWVVEQFRQKTNWLSKDLMEKASEELGEDLISAVKKARVKLGIKVQKLDRNWVCWVPEDWKYLG